MTVEEAADVRPRASRRDTALLPSRHRWYAAGVAALTAAVFLLTLAWSVVTPPMSTSDEPRHMNSVLRLMQGGGWPDARQAPMLEATRLASAEAGHPISGDAADPLPAPGDRSVVGGLDRASSPPLVDWMTQHPPGYYATVAGVLGILGGADWRWDQLLLGMRAISALLAAASVPFIAASARWMTGSHAAALVAGAVPLAIPQYAHVLGLVTNDTMATFLGAVLMYLATRAMIGPRPGYPLAVTAGLVLGAALLTKGLMLAAIPLILVAFLIGGIRDGGGVLRRLGPAAVSMIVAFAVGGWWWLRNLIVYGELQPSVFGSGRDMDEPDESYSPQAFALHVVRRLNDTLWGSFRPELDLPVWVSATAGVAALGLLVGAAILSPRRRALGILAIYPVLTFAIITYHSWEIFWDGGAIRGIQGRYLYGALTLLAVCVAICWWSAFHRRPAGVRSATAACAILVMTVLGLLGWRMAYRYLWGGQGIDAMLESGAMPLPAFIAAIAAGAAAVVIAALAAAGVAVGERAPAGIAVGERAPAGPQPGNS